MPSAFAYRVRWAQGTQVRCVTDISLRICRDTLGPTTVDNIPSGWLVPLETFSPRTGSRALPRRCTASEREQVPDMLVQNPASTYPWSGYVVSWDKCSFTSLGNERGSAQCSFTSLRNERGSAQAVPAEPIVRWAQGAQVRCAADISP